MDEFWIVLCVAYLDKKKLCCVKNERDIDDKEKMRVRKIMKMNASSKRHDLL